MSDNNKICDDLLTLFTTCKPFEGETAIFQENAIANWCQKFSNIIIFGNDTGSAEIAVKYNLTFVPDIEVDEDGLPILSSMFSVAQEMVTTPYLAYINSDIILSQGFENVVFSVIRKRQDRLLVVARRKNIPITFSTQSDEGKALFEQAIDIYATWDRANAIDLFLFNKDLYSGIPPFVIGRMAWDNWLLWKARDEGAEVIDISLDAFLYHPIHGYSTLKADRAEVAYGASAQRNKHLAGGNGLNIEQAATYFIEGGDIISLDDNRRYISQKCEIDQEKEFLSGLKYLKDGMYCRPPQQTVDCLKTILFRHNQFVPLSADLENRDDLADVKGILSSGSKDAACSLEDWIARPYIARILLAQEQGRQIYIWGAGSYGKRLQALLQRHSVEALGVLDSNLELLGDDFCGLKVLNYNTVIEHIDEKNLFILVASMYFVEIGTLLAELSLMPDVDFIA